MPIKKTLFELCVSWSQWVYYINQDCSKESYRKKVKIKILEIVLWIKKNDFKSILNSFILNEDLIFLKSV